MQMFWVRIKRRTLAYQSQTWRAEYIVRYVFKCWIHKYRGNKFFIHINTYLKEIGKILSQKQKLLPKFTEKWSYQTPAIPKWLYDLAHIYRRIEWQFKWYNILIIFYQYSKKENFVKEKDRAKLDYLWTISILDIIAQLYIWIQMVKDGIFQPQSSWLHAYFTLIKC